MPHATPTGSSPTDDRLPQKRCTQIKEQQGARRFLRRGMRACNAEWKLLCGTHNLLKLWRHTVTQPAARPATA